MYTVMSYIDIISGQNPISPQSYGFCKGPMAFDIATMQYLYGLNPSFNNGNDTYTITDVNQTGTGFSCIYDTNGEDLIIYNGSKKVNIDLRPANIQNNTGGGGYVSKVDDQTVYIGYTISNGTIIENATGSTNDDTFYQIENVENILDGKNGIDNVIYSNDFSNYVVSQNSDGSLNVSKNNIQDTLINIEKLKTGK